MFSFGGKKKSENAFFQEKKFLITVYLHVHELQLIDVLMWLFGNA